MSAFSTTDASGWRVVTCIKKVIGNLLVRKPASGIIFINLPYGFRFFVIDLGGCSRITERFISIRRQGSVVQSLPGALLLGFGRVSLEDVYEIFVHCGQPDTLVRICSTGMGIWRCTHTPLLHPKRGLNRYSCSSLER